MLMLEEVGKTFSTKKRKDGIKILVENNYDLAILDDGFQDFSIKKNFSILCFNQNQWIGNGLLIPSGPLREKLSSIKRADCIVINGNKDENIEKQINKIKKSKIFYSKYKPKDINKLKNKKIFAFAGIGNPINFFDLLKENEINIIEKIKFPDHYNYSENDFSKIIGDKNMKIITTEKDYFRMNDRQKQNCEFVKVDLEIENKSEFVNLIKNKVWKL